MNFEDGIIHREILNAETHVLVTGGPGSGKTTIALRKAKKYIDERKLLSGQKILFLSFSRSAITRIQESAKILTEKKYQDSISIQTFHSFFWEILKTHGYLLGSPFHLKVLAPHDEAALQSERDENDSEWLQEKQNLFFTKGETVFDLFAQKVLEIINRSSAIRDLLAFKFPLIIVDEAQDTDSEQWGCIKSFALKCQLIMLADLDQQIHDYREDIKPERMQDIIDELSPLVLTLGAQNHRSNTTEILPFARHLLMSTPGKNSYNGITMLVYNPRGNERDIIIRRSIGIIISKIRRDVGRTPEHIAILATWNSGVKIISQALKGSPDKKEIPHKVHFDENATYLSSRIIAFLLQPKEVHKENEDIVIILNLIVNFYRAKANKTNRKKWEKCNEWISAIHSGNPIGRVSMVNEIRRIISALREGSFSGNPENDWLYVQNLLLSSPCTELVTIIKNTKYLIAFNSGKMISKGLTNEWQNSGTYEKAISILDSSISRSQILSQDKTQKGINVMTIHKSKGKEFDGVIIFQNTHNSPFIARGDSEPYLRSKKLLFVGITRASHHTIIIRDPSEVCKFFDLP